MLIYSELDFTWIADRDSQNERSNEPNPATAFRGNYLGALKKPQITTSRLGNVLGKSYGGPQETPKMDGTLPERDIA
jgi:hypothetical protein